MVESSHQTAAQDAAAPSSPKPAAGLPAWLWGLLLVIALGSGVAWLGSRTGPSPPLPTGDLPVIAPVPDFSFAERSGRTVTRADMLGNVWVADFIFTNCAGPCPQLTLRMRGLQNRLPADWTDVRLVSISLDPTSDRPDVLTSYAQRHDADPQRWLFLTGEREKDVHELVQKGFLQAVARAAPDTAIIHSTYFVVVDKQGRMRSVHEGLAPSSTDAILRDIETLRRESGPPTP